MEGKGWNWHCLSLRAPGAVRLQPGAPGGARGVHSPFIPFSALPQWAGMSQLHSTARGDSLEGKELTGLTPVPEQAAVNKTFMRAGCK